MNRRFLFATLGVIAALVLVSVVAVSFQSAQAATGCTCPTGCATRTVQNAPFTISGVGEYCIESTNLGAYVQSWGADQVNITGVDYTNLYATTDSILRDTTGKFFVYYKATTTNGNFGTNGTSTITNCTAAWCSCAQYGQMAFNPFVVFNNAWGSADGTGQCIQANGPSQWTANATFPETGGVKTYPNSSLEMNGKTISNLGSCTSSFNLTVPTGGSWEAAYDLWVPSEIMIWMYKTGAVGPIAKGWNDDGTPIPDATNVVLGGATWDVYHGGANVISFVRQGNVTSGTLDILPLLNWSVAQGWISNTSNLGKFQFGYEITSAPGGLSFKLNSYSMNCGGLGGTVVPQPSSTPVKTATAGASLTPSITTTRSATPAVTLTRTPTAVFTLTRTSTAGTPSTLTRTPTAGLTATRTNTPVPPVITNTPPPGGTTCSPVTSSITAPFTYDGAGTFCWQSTNLGAYVNSWNTTSVTINGLNATNLYVASGSYPAKVNGYWYVSYSSSVAWGHFEAK
jgi:hypothetical protein